MIGWASNADWNSVVLFFSYGEILYLNAFLLKKEFYVIYLFMQLNLLMFDDLCPSNTLAESGYLIRYSADQVDDSRREGDTRCLQMRKQGCYFHICTEAIMWMIHMIE